MLGVVPEKALSWKVWSWLYSIRNQILLTPGNDQTVNEELNSQKTDLSEQSGEVLSPY